MKAIQSLLGDHCSPITPSFVSVICTGHPPSTGTVHSSGFPLRVERKQTVLPSGEKQGNSHLPMFNMADTLSEILVGTACCTDVVTGDSAGSVALLPFG